MCLVGLQFVHSEQGAPKALRTASSAGKIFGDSESPAGFGGAFD